MTGPEKRYIAYILGWVSLLFVGAGFLVGWKAAGLVFFGWFLRNVADAAKKSSNGWLVEKDSTELKLCPFCGAPADHSDPPNETDDGYCCCSNEDCFACGFDVTLKDWNTRYEHR